MDINLLKRFCFLKGSTRRVEILRSSGEEMVHA